MVKQIDEGQGLAGTLLNDTVFAYGLQEVMHDLQTTGEELSSLSSSLRSSLEGIDKGEGLVNTLMHDPGASEDLKQTLDNLNKGTAMFNENMEAMRHNFLFRKYFKKQEKQGESIDTASQKANAITKGTQ